MRSVMNLMRQAAKGLTLDAQPAAVEMFTFSSPQVVDKWHVFSDAYFGGRSHAALIFNEEEQAAEFSGRVTLEQEEDADIKRAGYCVASSKVTHIGDYWDVSGCTHLVLRVKGDGRAYIANVRTDSIAGTGGDVWQAPFKTRPGDWQSVCIPLQSLVLTYQGQLVKRRLEFQANQVISVGVAASAIPGAEAEAVGGVNIPENLTELASASSSSSAADEAGSDAVDSSPPAAGDVTGEESSVEGADSSNYPQFERFKLLIRSIHAEVEW